eukprot:m.32689 g.32689  ORF g.32689 m.32689 type:complete len:129 (+) comp8440_c0_seq1:342-728(+)
MHKLLFIVVGITTCVTFSNAACAHVFGDAKCTEKIPAGGSGCVANNTCMSSQDGSSSGKIICQSNKTSSEWNYLIYHIADCSGGAISQLGFGNNCTLLKAFGIYMTVNCSANGPNATSNTLLSSLSTA